MIDITCIRGNGDRPLNDIVDPLLATIPAALHRGRVELDEHELADEITFEIPLTNIALGKIVFIEDEMLQFWKGKVTGIQHNAQIDADGNLEATTTPQFEYFVMHPIKQLRKILNIQQQNQGKVIQQFGDSMVVATTMGSQTIKLSALDKTNYQVGDTIILNNNTIVGKRLNNTTVYVV